MGSESSSSSSEQVSFSSSAEDGGNSLWTWEVKHPIEINQDQFGYIVISLLVMSIHAPSADLLSTEALNNALFTPCQPLAEFASLRRVVDDMYVKFNAKTRSVQFKFKYVNLNAPWGWGQGDWDARPWTNTDYARALRKAVEICMPEEPLPGRRAEPTHPFEADCCRFGRSQLRRRGLGYYRGPPAVPLSGGQTQEDPCADIFNTVLTALGYAVDDHYCRRHPLEAFFQIILGASWFSTWDQALDLAFAPTGPELYQQAQDALDEHLEYIMPFEIEGSGNCFVVQQEGHKFTLQGESNPVNKSSEPVKLDKALTYMLGGDNSKHLVVDFCCGSGSFALAGLTLGYHTLALDNDVGQLVGFQSRVRKFGEEHLRIMRKAIKPPTKDCAIREFISASNHDAQDDVIKALLEKHEAELQKPGRPFSAR
eukprot:g14776.t1